MAIKLPNGAFCLSGSKFGPRDLTHHATQPNQPTTINHTHRPQPDAHGDSRHRQHKRNEPSRILINVQLPFTTSS
ncbi:hypothetical protein CISIN_1g038609mg [Citrus sinensis]|uniref:Uncharacterized protein n=1 Tax=Citrus sinensis TaxID=2711 RepID=A0A067EA95_CITSI|nr:hypothetical protein CISIN_1g038609mg [Citrus sinensis]